MKYIVEVLSRPGSGAATTVYGNREQAESALDTYKYHRSGQPVVVLYHGKDGVEALIAVGTGNNSYYIIGSQTTNNYYTNLLSANNVIVDPIDVTDLLSAHGPGYDFDTAGEYESVGTDRHFGWLGTEQARWALKRQANGSWVTKSMTVQSMFEAILYGKKINKEVTPPDVEIYLSTINTGGWTQELVLSSADEVYTKNIWVKLVCNNIFQLPNNTVFNVDPSSSLESDIYNLFVDGRGEIIYEATVVYSPEKTEFTIYASNDGGTDFDTAYLYWDYKPDPEPPVVKYTVTTGIPTIHDIETDFNITFYGNSSWISQSDDTWFELYRSNNDIVTINTLSAKDSQNWTYSFDSSAYNLEEGKSYAYRALAKKDGKTKEGDWVTFILNREIPENPKFTFVVVGGGGYVEGFINGSSVTTGETHEFNSQWSVTPTAADGYEYKESSWYIGNTNYISYNPDNIKGKLTNDVTVYVYFKLKDEPDPSANYYQVDVEVFKNNTLVTPYSNYINISGVYNWIVEGEGNVITVSPKSGYTYCYMQIKNDPSTKTYQDQLVIDSMTSNLTVQVYITDQDSYSINLSKEPEYANAVLKINGIETTNKVFSDSNPVTISCEPKDDWNFINWTNSIGDVISTNTEFIYSANKSITLIAHLTKETPSEKIIVTVKSDDNTKGTVTPTKNNEEVPSGTTITSVAAPNDGYQFLGWKRNGTTISSEVSLSDTLTAPGTYTYIAYFIPIQCTVTYKIEDQYKNVVQFSNGSAQFDETVSKNSTITLSKTLNNNEYSIDYWIKNNETTHISHGSSQIITENVTYTAYLKHEEQVRVQYKFDGTKETQWQDCWNRASDMATNAYYNYSSPKYAWTSYSNRETSDQRYHIPLFFNRNLKNIDEENGVRTIIDTHGLSVTVYIYDSDGWVEDPQGFNNTIYWKSLGNNQYSYDIEGDNAKASICIKYQ